MIIYKHYNQEQLNNQYNNRLHVPDFETYFGRWDKLSEETRKNRVYIKDLEYGDHSRECLDIFPSAMPNSKALVFIHGGYWQQFDKTKFHFVADAFLLRNITTVLINYPLAPAATMDEMVASCHKAMRWLQQNLSAFNGDPKQVYIIGHSAGAHLAAMLVEKESVKAIQNHIRGICTISGLFDLLPIQLSYINQTLHIDKEMALRNSPIELLPAQDCPILIAAGTAETEEFKDQGRKFYNNWKNKAGSVELIELPGLNHFSILDSLVDENAFLHKRMVKLMEK